MSAAENALEYSFSHAGATRTVHRLPPSAANARKRGVILMHELPGLTDPAADFGVAMMKEGFDVHMPLFFGKYRQWTLGKRNPLPGVLRMLCIRREFTALAANQPSAITDWVRALARHVSATHEGEKVGVIGMCMSGGWVFSLALDFSVGAAIAGHTAMPFRTKDANQDELGDTQETVRKALKSGTPILASLFEGDWRSPKTRRVSLVQVYADANEGALRTDTYSKGDGCGKSEHSVYGVGAPCASKPERTHQVDGQSVPLPDPKDWVSSRQDAIVFLKGAL